MKSPFLRMVGGVGVMILLAGCRLPETTQPERPPEDEAQETQPAQAGNLDEEARVLDVDETIPELGSWMYWFDNSILVYIPAGEFAAGDSQFEDNPPHTTTLSAYWIYRNPVTNDMYRQCVMAGACEEPATEPPYEDVFDPDRADHPVVGVDWEKAWAYCQWMSAELPTEAQWEKAARGANGNPYPWGNDEPNCSYLNYLGCVGDTTPAQEYYPEGLSDYKLMDMAGNTFEWTRDWYQEDYSATAPETNPAGPETGLYRSIRSSGFNSGLDILHLAHRAYLQPEKYREDLGFRCVVTEPSHFAPYCEQVAYIPGENKGPGDPPPGSPDLNEHQIPDCETDELLFSVGSYCYDQASQLGGASVNYSGALQSVTGASCDSGNPMGCWGPENSSFEVTLCAECQNWVPPNYQNPSCDPGYTLVDDKCIFYGIPPIPATTCPAGWFLDMDGYCKPWCVPVDPDCPQGFQYNPASQCCEATFIEPSGGWAGIPGAQYSSCPIGYDYLSPPGICVYEGQWVTGQSCQSFTGQLGNCRDQTNGKCSNPGQYSSQSACEAAGCKWTPSPTGGGGGSCGY
ncbi:MAG: SUMF1/EgtB/PvdO family nonheme iron enzyme [Anaerolineales bacterium]|nr:SUMF1/EgtB/PvdO family nonheme iron enzyme [Anaerolineales bacterium]